MEVSLSRWGNNNLPPKTKSLRNLLDQMLLRVNQVQAIIGKAKQDRRVYYLVKWTHKQVQQSTWQHRTCCSNIKELISDFNNSLPNSIVYPYIREEYRSLLQNKLNSKKIQRKQIEQQMLKGRVEMILGKAKIMGKKFYLIKWQFSHVWCSTWQESYRLNTSITKTLAKFNKSISQMQLPYIDQKTIEEIYYAELDQKNDSKENKSKKQSLRDKKQMKEKAQQLKSMFEHFKKRLRRITKSLRVKRDQKCHERALKTTQSIVNQKQHEQTQNENNIHIKQQEIHGQKYSESDDECQNASNEDQISHHNFQLNQQTNFKHQFPEISKQQEFDNFSLPPLIDSEDQLDLFDKQKVINKIQTKIEHIQNSQVKPIIQSDSANFKSSKYNKEVIVQPKMQYVLSSSDQKNHRILEISSCEEKRIDSHDSICKKSPFKKKALIKNSDSTQVQNLGKIILVKRENNIQAISGSSKQEQLYRFEYEKNGEVQVRFWTTSQVKKIPNHFEQLIDYLESVAYGHSLKEVNTKMQKKQNN